MRRWIGRTLRPAVIVMVVIAANTAMAAGENAAAGFQSGSGFPGWSLPVTFTSGADLSTPAPILWSGSVQGAVLKRFGEDATTLAGAAVASTDARGSWRPAGGVRVAKCLWCLRDGGLYLNVQGLAGRETIPISAGALLDIPTRETAFVHVGVWVTRDVRQHDWSATFAVGTDVFRWLWHP